MQLLSNHYYHLPPNFYRFWQNLKTTRFIVKNAYMAFVNIYVASQKLVLNSLFKNMVFQFISLLLSIETLRN